MKEMLLNISIVSVIIALVKMLIPENVFKKQTNFLVTCVFIISVMFFVMTGEYDFSAISDTLESQLSYSDFTDTVRQSQKHEIALEVSKQVSEILADENIAAKEIHVIVNISDSNSISINKIKLVLEEHVDHARAASAVKRGLGVVVVTENA